jgi:hypothetical protein
MKIAGNLAGTVGLLWLGYFWLAVLCYPRIRFATPNLNRVVTLTLLSAALCALAGKLVSKKWWAGILLAITTLIVIYARVR